MRVSFTYNNEEYIYALDTIPELEDLIEFTTNKNGLATVRVVKRTFCFDKSLVKLTVESTQYSVCPAIPTNHD